MTPFEELLKELGSLLGDSLQPDAHASCCLDFVDAGRVQIDLDHSGEKILLGSTLGPLPPGLYREKVLRHALILNGQETRHRGTLAFAQKTDSLVLFQFLNLHHLTGEKLYPIILAFAADVKNWKEAFKKGELPPLDEEVATKSGFMGVK